VNVLKLLPGEARLLFGVFMTVLMPDPIMRRFNRYMKRVDHSGGQAFLDQERERTKDDVDALIERIARSGELLKAAKLVAASSDAVVAFLLERVHCFEQWLQELPPDCEIELPADPGLLFKIFLLDCWKANGMPHS
jgi:hypothetical protein